MRSALITLALFLTVGTLTFAQLDPALYSAARWRMIGPHRGGRTVGAVGVPQQPNVFYIGINNGGVWKTTDYGRTWTPIFDDQPTGSVGDIAVAPSNPQILYVGCGEGLQRPDLSVGNGMYRSADGGKTWQHLGLENAQQIAGVDVDPNNPDRVFVAALGHPYGPNPERGIYRSLNGGKSWDRVLYIDENTGAMQVTIDPQNPNIVYADLWAGRQGPWENGAWQGPGSGLYKSTDGGNTWNKLTQGLPTFEQGLGRIGFCVSRSNPNRLYAVVDAPQLGGLYRSDDGGASWQLMNNDRRLWGRGSDFAECKADPQNPDIVYIANVVTWKSTDGGKTWEAFRGAPGGDDYHRVWINPDQPNIILIASDQGAIITVNGGQTYSSWYNQPTAQFYHVSTDNDFPYNVYGGQQESGSVCIASRSNDGQITYRDWLPVGVEEYGYIAADPLDPNIIFGGKITRFDKRTGQTQNIAPEAVRSGKYRFLRTAPVLFSPIDPHTLYFAGNVVFKTLDGGNSWQVISPDLSRSTWEIPPSVGVYTTEELKTMPRRGVVYTLAPSSKDINIIWAGTDDGLIHVTRDGGTSWTDVTPPAITSWSKVSLIDAGHFDANTAYAAVNRIRCDDMHPHIYRTHDGGKTWKEIVVGLPDDPINVVREDPVQPGLLFAGSERAVYISFDDGDHWQSLRLNMPATSTRDLVIKDDDIVVGTHGRSFWILDNIAPLRQLSVLVARQPVILFHPAVTYRVRWSTYPDTPLPQEEPAGENPPDGAMIDYYLLENAKGEVVLEIKDAAGNMVRRYSSNDKPYDFPAINVPEYWVRPQQVLSGAAGAHRFIWDLHYAPLPGEVSYPIGAVYRNTAPNATSPWVMPGDYTVSLTVNGQTYTQTLKILMDPRVKSSMPQLQEQHDLSYMCYEGRQQLQAISHSLEKIRQQVKTLIPKAKKELVTTLQQLDLAAEDLEKISQLDRPLSGLFDILQDTDMPATTQAKSAATDLKSQITQSLSKWGAFTKEELPSVNKQLRKARLATIEW